VLLASEHACPVPTQEMTQCSMHIDKGMRVCNPPQPAYAEDYSKRHGYRADLRSNPRRRKLARILSALKDRMIKRVSSALGVVAIV
jgi:hypothetical protein